MSIAGHGPRKTYTVQLNGCDNSTIIVVRLTRRERFFLESLVILFDDESTYGCMPTMSIEEVKEAAS